MRLNLLRAGIYLSLSGQSDFVALKRYEEFIRNEYVNFLLEGISNSRGCTTAAK